MEIGLQEGRGSSIVYQIKKIITNENKLKKKRKKRSSSSQEVNIMSRSRNSLQSRDGNKSQNKEGGGSSCDFHQKVKEMFNLANEVKRVRMRFSKSNENNNQGFPEANLRIDDVAKQVANDLFESKIGEVSSEIILKQMIYMQVGLFYVLALKKSASENLKKAYSTWKGVNSWLILDNSDDLIKFSLCRFSRTDQTKNALIVFKTGNWDKTSVQEALTSAFFNGACIESTSLIAKMDVEETNQARLWEESVESQEEIMSLSEAFDKEADVTLKKELNKKVEIAVATLAELKDEMELSGATLESLELALKALPKEDALPLIILEYMLKGDHMRALLTDATTQQRIMVGLGAESKKDARMCVEREILTVARSIPFRNRRKKKVMPKASPLPKTSRVSPPVQNAWNIRSKKSSAQQKSPNKAPQKSNVSDMRAESALAASMEKKSALFLSRSELNGREIQKVQISLNKLADMLAHGRTELNVWEDSQSKLLRMVELLVTSSAQTQETLKVQASLQNKLVNNQSASHKEL